MSSSESSSELDRYVPAGQIEDRQVAELALVGLSPQFPEIVGRLNASLLRGYNTYSTRSFMGYRFSLSPDPDRPRVDVQEDRSFPYNITVDSDVLKRGKFAVESVHGFSHRAVNAHVINWVGHSSLQAFAGAYPGEPELRVQATRLDGGRGSIDLPLSELPDETAFETVGIEKDKYAVTVGFSHDEHTRLLLPMVYTAHGGGNSVKAFGIGDILALDSASNIERILAAYSNLVDTETE